MINYYLTDLEGNITNASVDKFDANCLSTEENIVRCPSSGALYLQSVFDEKAATGAYLNAQKAVSRASVALEYKDLFKELDISYSGKVARGLTTSQAYTAARSALQSELVTKLSEV